MLPAPFSFSLSFIFFRFYITYYYFHLITFIFLHFLLFIFSLPLLPITLIAILILILRHAIFAMPLITFSAFSFCWWLRLLFFFHAIDYLAAAFIFISFSSRFSFYIIDISPCHWYMLLSLSDAISCFSLWYFLRHFDTLISVAIAMMMRRLIFSLLWYDDDAFFHLFASADDIFAAISIIYADCRQRRHWCAMLPLIFIDAMPFLLFIYVLFSLRHIRARCWCYIRCFMLLLIVPLIYWLLLFSAAAFAFRWCLFSYAIIFFDYFLYFRFRFLLIRHY